MQKITKSKTNARLKQRQMLNVSNKMAYLTTFSNEKVNSAIITTQKINSIGNRNSPICIQQKSFSFVVSPKYEINNKIILSFDDFVQTKNTFRKILKHSSLCRGEKNIKNNLILRRLSMDKCKDRTLTQSDSTASHKTKRSLCLPLENHNYFRKEIEQKFQKTRLIFREEGKLKHFDKINRIYERKNNLFNRLQHSEDVNQLAKSQKEKLSPWMKSRLEKTNIYEIEENYQSEDY